MVSRVIDHRSFKIVPVPEKRGYLKIVPKTGGELPSELQGQWSSANAIKLMIDHYIGGLEARAPKTIRGQLWTATFQAPSAWIKFGGNTPDVLICIDDKAKAWAWTYNPKGVLSRAKGGNHSDLIAGYLKKAETVEVANFDTYSFKEFDNE